MTRRGASHAAAATLPLDNTVAIETPEHIQFRHYVAGPTRRFLAYMVDLGLRLLIGGAFAAVIALAAGGSARAEGVGQGVVLVAMFALEWIYFVVFETLTNGRSPGKRALRLRVVKDGGEPITFIDSLLRNLLRAADFLPLGYALGCLAMVTDGRFRRLGDRVAGTMVVIEQAGFVQAPPKLSPAPQPAELALLPTRVPLSTDELDALDMFVRRVALSDARRTELAEMVAPLWAERVHLPGVDPVRLLNLLHVRASSHAGDDGAAPTEHGLTAS